ncbi:MAG: TlpA family protein disulfide reductase [Deltaproteobacteria bacterium]|nr:MAG: TlpA family protein disulfide reductase [Deltaproteobacteria bacterium]
MSEEQPSPRHRALAWAKEIALTLIVGVVLILGMSWLRAPSLDHAPDFTLLDLHGEPVNLADYRGQTVVVNFWATWCGPCRMEAPSFSAFAEAHPDVPVLGVVADGPPAKVRATAKDIGITYPVLLGDRETLAAYEVSAFPTTVVVNPDGSVRWVHTGMMMRPMIAWSTGRIW